MDWASTCGLFGIYKSPEKDRLILDARPRNSLEVPQTRWTRYLADPYLVHEMHLEENQVLALSGCDIKDFYHAFVVGEPRARRNALPLLLLRDALVGFVSPGALPATPPVFVPCLRARALGD